MKMLQRWAAALSGVRWIADDRLVAECPICHSANSLQARQNGQPTPIVVCLKGHCKKEQIIECLNSASATDSPSLATDTSSTTATVDSNSSDKVQENSGGEVRSTGAKAWSGSKPSTSIPNDPFGGLPDFGDFKTAGASSSKATTISRESVSSGAAPVSGSKDASKAPPSGPRSQERPASTGYDTRPSPSSSAEILRRVPPQDVAAEQSVLGAILLENSVIELVTRILKADDFYREAHRCIFRAMRELASARVGIDAVTLNAELNRTGHLEMAGGMSYITELAVFVPTAAHTEHYANIVKSMAGKRKIASTASEIVSLAYDGVSYNALVGEMERLVAPISADVPAVQTLAVEGFEDAEVANAEYLKRPALVENLLFGQSISLTVGGKHAGKSTLSRTLAISVVKPEIDLFLGRKVAHGPVLYAASDDEVMNARAELLRMGWKKTDALNLVHLPVGGNGPIPNVERILEMLAEKAVKMQAVLIVLDMLFDFAGVRDEMSYAGTREAGGRIQRLADWTTSQVNSTHHAPKYMMESATAATAALGSQGLAARFSPIILARHWGADLYTVESTATRDPRGVALAQTVVELGGDGRIYDKGPFKSFMKWKLFAPRVYELMEGDEPGKEWSVDAVARALDINRPEAQNTLYNLWREERIARERKGKGYRYFIAVEGQASLSDQDQADQQKQWGGWGQN